MDITHTNISRFIGLSPVVYFSIQERLTARCRYLATLREHDAISHIVPYLEGPMARYYSAYTEGKLSDLSSFSIEESSIYHRPRIAAFITQALIIQGEYDEAEKLSRHAMHMVESAGDTYLVYQLAKTQAVLYGSVGDHKRAISKLHELFPLIRRVSKSYPVLYFDYLNSLAFELSEARNFNEAKRLIQLALQSPYAHIYPEWIDTYENIRRHIYTPRLLCGIKPPDCDISPVVSNMQEAPTESNTHPGKLLFLPWVKRPPLAPSVSPIAMIRDEIITAVVDTENPPPVAVLSSALDILKNWKTKIG